MLKMFMHASSFNQDLSDWNVCAVTDMSHMFDEAISMSNLPSWLDSSNGCRPTTYQQGSSFCPDTEAECSQYALDHGTNSVTLNGEEYNNVPMGCGTMPNDKPNAVGVKMMVFWRGKSPTADTTGSEVTPVCSEQPAAEQPAAEQPAEKKQFYLKNVQNGICLHTSCCDGGRCWGTNCYANSNMKLRFEDERSCQSSISGVEDQSLCVARNGCAGDKNRFEYVDAGNGNFYLKNVQSGACVHTKQDVAEQEGQLVYWQGCSGDKNLFTKVDAGNGNFYLKNVQSGVCVHTNFWTGTASGLPFKMGSLVYWQGCEGEKNLFTEIPLEENAKEVWRSCDITVAGNINENGYYCN
jgi:surface protein